MEATKKVPKGNELWAMYGRGLEELKRRRRNGNE